MTLLSPFRKWSLSLLEHLELGRKRRLNRERWTGVGTQVELLEKKAMLAAAPPAPVVAQIDITPVMNADVVVNKPGSGSGSSAYDSTQTSVDRNISGGDWSMLTQTAAAGLVPGNDTANGLPDSGFFSANAFHPDVQLSYSNTDSGNNARRADVDGLVSTVANFGFTLSVPRGNYSDLHVFLTSGHGTSTFTLKLNYTDGSSTTSTAATVPDWFNPVTNSTSVYNLITGMDREQANLSGYQDSNAATIFGFHFAANSSKTLTSFTLTPVNVQGSIVFFGATGVLANRAPVLSAIADQNINEQSSFMLTASATDPDGNLVTYSLDSAPAGVSINSASGLISWTPTESQGPGDYTITVRATDNGTPALSDVKSFHLHVNEVNIAPTLASPGDQTLNELTPLNFTLSATDPDLPPNTLTYSFASGSLPGMTLNSSTGAFSWTPSELQDGDAHVTFTVSDNAGGSDSKTIKIHVNEVNRPPVMQAVANQEINEESQLAIDFGALVSDPDSVNGHANHIQFSLGSATTADGSKINPALGLLTWTPTEFQGPGLYQIQVIATDDGSPQLSASQIFTVQVDEVNRAPSLANPGSHKSVDEQSTITFALLGSDPDFPPNQLTYVIESGYQDGMLLDPVSGQFSWTPTEVQDGTYDVTFKVYDNGSPVLGSDSRTVTFDVREVNAAPLLNVYNPPVVVKTTTLNFQVASATDSDFVAGVPNTLTYGLVQTGGPATSGAAIDPATGYLSWTPSADQPTGVYTFNVSVNDNTGSANSVVTQPITVTVSSVGVVNGDLLVVGTSLNDNISVNPSSGNQISVVVNSETHVVDGASVTGKINVLAFQGTDTVQVSGAVGLAFDVEESGSSDTLIVMATAGNDNIALANQTIIVDGNLIAFSNEAVLIIDALGGDDSVAMSGHAGAASTTINGGMGYNSFTATLTGDFNSILNLQDLESASITIAGNLGGSVTSAEDPAAPGSGVLNSLTVYGSITSSGFVGAGAIADVLVTGNMDGTMIAAGAGTITGTTIGGTLTGSMTAVEDVSSTGVPADNGSGVISGTTVHSVGSTGTITGGALTGVTVTSDMAGTIKAQGAGTLTGITIGGTLTGSMTAVEDVSSTGVPADNGSGVISGTTVHSVGSTGTITGGALTGVTVTSDMAGTIKAQGAGTLTGITIGGTLTGSMTAVEDSNAGSGVISDTTVGSVGSKGTITGGALTDITIIGSLTGSMTAVEGSNSGSGVISDTTVGSLGSHGTITGGALTGVTVTSDMAGTIKAQGAGTLTDITIGGSLTGSMTAVEDVSSTGVPVNNGSGVISGTTVNSVGSTGTITGGALTGVTVTSDMAGTIKAQGAGTLTDITIGGSLTGSMTAVEDVSSTGVPVNNGSGVISGTTVNSVGSTGTITGGALTGVTVTSDMAGTIKAQGAGTLTDITIGGSLTGSMTAVEDSNAGSGVISDTTVGSVGSKGTITGGALTDITIIGSLTGSMTAVEGSNSGSGVISDTTVGSVGSHGTITGGALTGVTVTSDMAGTIKAQGAGTLTDITIGGSLTGSMTAVEDVSSTGVPVNNGSGVISGTTVNSVGSTGTITGGALTGVTVTSDMAGTIKAQGAGTLTDITIGGSLTGSMTAVEDSNAGSGVISDTTVGSVGSKGTITGGALTDITIIGSLTGSMTAVEGSNSGSGVISDTTVGSVGSHGTITGGALTGVTVTSDMAGTIKAQGAGTLTDITIIGSLTGSMTAVEDTNNGVPVNNGSGVISGTTVGSVGSTGTITGGALTGVTVTSDMAGTIKAQGAGTLTDITIGGSLTGSMTAVEDTNNGVPVNNGSGVISGTTVGSVGSTGTITGGALTGVTVTSDMAGTIKAQGAGTITGTTIGGSLTGSMTAVEDANAGSGTISGTTVGSVGSTGTMTGGTLTGVTVSSDMAGTITAQGAGTMTGVVVKGNVLGRIEAKVDANAGSGKIGTLTVGGISGKVLSKDIDVLTVAGVVAGSVNASGTIGQATVATVAAGGSLTSNSLTTLNVSNDAGQVNVTNTIASATVGTIAGTGSLAAGTLSSMTVTGSIAGNLSAANVGQCQATNVAATGTSVFKVMQGGVVRQVVAFPVNAATLSGVKFSYIYDGTSGVNPQVAIHVTNGGSTTFDLELVANSAKEFDLARLDASGTSGIHNVVVQGNVLSSVTADTAKFLSLPLSAVGGVQLPSDNLNGVFAADNIPAASISASSIQAVAFGSVTKGSTKTSAPSATTATANSVLASGTRLIQAGSNYVVPFSENQPVDFFYISAGDQGTTGNEGAFAEAPVLFTDQLVDNQANLAALTTSVGTGNPKTTASRIQAISITGTGGSIQTSQWIQSSISSTGTLGDLTLSSSQGITAHITATSIFGNISASSGPITGIIETRCGDLGRTIVDGSGKITGVTSIQSNGAFSGKIISRGDLVSSITVGGGMSGVIAAQGDIGAIKRDSLGSAVWGSDVAKSLTRFGAIVINGGLSGQLIALGNIFCDMTINGGLAGRIAVKGQQVTGLDAQRYGILGKVTINGGISSTGAIVSAGVIGDDGVYIGTDSDSNGTQLIINGNIKAIVAAESDINFGGNTKSSGTIENASSGCNKTAIDAIFTQCGLTLTFDTVVNGKSGLDWILADLNALAIGSNGYLTGTTA